MAKMPSDGIPYPLFSYAALVPWIYFSQALTGSTNSLVASANLLSKVYFPNTFNDFNESDPGMMFVEMASYVGDVLSYYIDSQLKESILTTAEERENIIQLAQAMGYIPRASVGAVIDFCQQQVQVQVQDLIGIMDF